MNTGRIAERANFEEITFHALRLVGCRDIAVGE
jgi:hypothetical protein